MFRKTYCLPSFLLLVCALILSAAAVPAVHSSVVVADGPAPGPPPIPLATPAPVPYLV